MADLRSAFGMGGGGGSSKKSKVVADLTTGFEALNRAMTKTAELSKTIFDNLSKAKQAGTGIVTGSPSAGSATTAMSFAPSSPAPSVNGGGAAGGGGGFPAGEFVDPPSAAAKSMSFNLGTFAKTSIAAMNQAIDPATYIENDIARRRYAFFSGMGNTSANNAQLGSGFQRMMNAGTATDPMDAARAAMSGISNGLMAGIQQKSGVFNTVTGVSNMVPGAGLEGGMNAAAALNSAGSVNRLRMIGVKVRDDNGMPRALEAIARDIWNKLQGIARTTGGGKITTADLDRSLMDGNSLDSMLDQYFSGDPVLRQSVVSYLYQFASGQPTTKAGLKASNANPAISQSIASRNAAGYRVDNAYTSAGVEGTIAANKILENAANMFADSVEAFKYAVTAMTFLQTLAGGAGGAAGTFGAGTIGSFSRGSKGGSKGGGSTGGSRGWGKTGPGGWGGWKGGLKMGGIMAGANLLMSAPGNIEATKRGKGGSAWGNTIGSTVGGVAGAAIGQALIPIPVVGGLIGGMVGGWLGGMAGEAIGSNFDQGVGGEGTSEIVSPLEQKLVIPKDGEYLNKAAFRKHPHRGVDFQAKMNTPVRAVKAGIASKGYSNELGNYVRIKHPDGKTTTYAHLNRALVSNGQSVNPGEHIGDSGKTGYVTGPHLHFAVEDTSSAKMANPMPYLAGAAGGAAVGAVTTSTNGTVNAVSASSSNASSASSGKLFNFSGETQSLFSGMATDSHGGVGGEGMGGGVNYGGVTVNISVPKGAHMDEHKLAREVKRILQDEEQIRMAVIR